MRFIVIFLEKSYKNIWWEWKIGVPLHPQTRNGGSENNGASLIVRCEKIKFEKKLK